MYPVKGFTRKCRFAIVVALMALSSSEAMAQKIDTIAVLPFQSHGAFQDTAIWRFGFPEALASHLAKVPGITIVDRVQLSLVLQEMSLGQSGVISSETAMKVGSVIGARFLITGAVYRIDRAVRMVIQLIEISTSKLTASAAVSEAYARPGDYFIVEAKGIREFFRHLAKLNPSFAMQPPAFESDENSLAAFSQFSQALENLDNGNPQAAQRLMEMAIRSDSRFYKAKILRTRVQEAFDELERAAQKFEESKVRKP